jgi:O-antigen/teichoic acid export membrane protein
LVLPLVLVLIVFGGQVMELWMGPNYANGFIPAVMAIGFLGACIQTPILFMLEGLNAHGRAGLGQFIGSALSAAFVFLALRHFDAGLMGATVAVTLPLLIVNAIYLPLLLCRRLGQRLQAFYGEVAAGPLLRVLPFALCLIIGRLIFKVSMPAALAVCLVGAAILAVSYWKSVLPERLKAGVRRYFNKAIRVARFSGTGGTVGEV